MNWHMIISVLTIVVLKIVGMTLFLLYFPQIFGGSEDSLLPTEIYGRVSPTFGSSDVSSVPTESSRTACSRTWYFLQRRCFWLSPFELSWNKSRDFCKREASTLAIVDTPEKLKFLQDKTGAEKYFIGLYQQEKNRWHWIDNSVFNGNKPSLPPVASPNMFHEARSSQRISAQSPPHILCPQCWGPVERERQDLSPTPNSHPAIATAHTRPSNMHLIVAVQPYISLLDLQMLSAHLPVPLN
ncbi:C-type lectin domain family 5 member A isoform X1 [Canis aureus]